MSAPLLLSLLLLGAAPAGSQRGGARVTPPPLLGSSPASAPSDGALPPSARLPLLLLGAAPVKGARPAPPAKLRPSPPPVADAPLTTSPALPPPPPVARHAPAGDTRCGACHVTASWSQVRFDHDRTGFRLAGAHAGTGCKACHPTDFERPLPTTCGGCHADPHVAELGSRCEACHTTADWRSRYDADAHRRSNFPLVGGHAAIPCLECHAESSGRRFSRPAVDCGGCHQVELARTRGTDVDHVALGFSNSCRGCHAGFRFKPALYPGHDACYVISSGSHARTPCLGCHLELKGSGAAPGSCATRTADCTRCHEQLTSSSIGTAPTDALHLPPRLAAPVPGYQYASRKCWACHRQDGR